MPCTCLTCVQDRALHPHYPAFNGDHEGVSQPSDDLPLVHLDRQSFPTPTPQPRHISQSLIDSANKELHTLYIWTPPTSSVFILRTLKGVSITHIDNTDPGAFLATLKLARILDTARLLR